MIAEKDSSRGFATVRASFRYGAVMFFQGLSSGPETSMKRDLSLSDVDIGWRNRRKRVFSESPAALVMMADFKVGQ